MPFVNRVLDAVPVGSLDEYVAGGGGSALAAARQLDDAKALIETVEASGLRGRGGAGFPTGTKWRTVAAMGGAEPATVVVNAAEGEPGTFKDRAILRANPYRVIEGALIAAVAVGADRIIIALKDSFDRERVRVDEAIAEITAAEWAAGISVESFAGPGRYLYGEETALLEVLNGRPPFPRIAPPYRHGAEEVSGEPGEGGGAASTTLVDEPGDTSAPPTLVDNVETLANVPLIIGKGPEAFRSLGTTESPGTIVCTVSGRTERAGVGEVELGTPLREVIEQLGGTPLGGRIVGVLSGTANPILTADQLDAPVSWEGLEAAGGGLGSAGFIVIDDAVDIVAVAQGVSRFLAIESCGQCTPCKQDGMAMAELLDRSRRSQSEEDDLATLPVLASRVTDGARCYLAQQHQNVVESLLASFPEALALHAERRADEAERFFVAPLADIVDDQAVLDETQADVTPDWGAQDDGSGATPADRIDTRAST